MRKRSSPSARYAAKDGYIVDMAINGGAKQIAREIALEAVEANLDTDMIVARVAFDYRGNRRVCRLPRGQMTVRGLLQLRDFGADVTEDNARELFEYLHGQEEAAPVEYSHDRLGWDTLDGLRVFKHWRIVGGPVSTYSGSFDLEPRGTLEGQLQLIREEILPHPPMALALVIGLMAPLISIFSEATGLETVLFNAIGASGSGKTTAAGVVAFGFGRPDGSMRRDTLMKRDRAGLILSWSGTENALMNSLAYNYGVPIVFDELGSHRGEGMKRMAYALASGRDRARMAGVEGLAPTATWSTVVFSTVEESWVEQAGTYPGIAARLIEIRLPQWTASREHAERIAARIRQHYGHIGPAFVEFLMGLPEERVIEVWQRRADDCRARMKIADRVSGRIANKYGAILATADLASQCLGPVIDAEAIWSILEAHERDSSTARDIGQEAYERLRGACWRIPTYFRDAAAPRRAARIGGWSARTAARCISRRARSNACSTSGGCPTPGS